MKSPRKPSAISSGYFPALAAATFGLFALGVSATSGAALRAQLERNSVQEGDTLTLNIESEGAQSGERPDVTPLGKDFEVLGTSSSSETTFVNGSRSDRTRWLVRLQPRHTGTIDIPPITVGSEHTAVLELKVTQAPPQASNRAARHVFLEIEAAPAGKAIYVQQQVPYTVRLYYDDTIQTGDLAAPDPANAIVEQLGEEKRYTAMHDGREYNVIERRYAIAPEKSGALAIPPATFRGSAVIAQDHQSDTDPANDLMKRFLRDSPLANDPFFKGNLGAGMEFGEEKPVTARGQEITLDVQPRPAAQGNWLPAEQITLHDSWQDDPPQFKVGEPVTRTVTIEAKGLTASQIPPLSFARPGNARLYPEASDNQSRTDGNAIFGISKQSVTYIPTAQGRLDIPPVELAWWNTRGNIQDRAVLPAREFNVAPGAIEAQSNAAPPSPAGVAMQARALTAPMTADHPGQNASLMERMWNSWPWFAGGLALLTMMILATVIMQRSRRLGLKVVQRSATRAPMPRRRSAMRALHRACFTNDGRAAAQALLDLARAEWPDDPPRGLSALAARLEAGGVEIVSLDRSLYGHGSHWQGPALWHVLHRGLEPKCSKTWREDDGLEALYL